MSLVAFVVACTGGDPPLTIRAEPAPIGFLVESSAPLEQVELTLADGAPVLRRSVPHTDRVSLSVDVPPGTYRLRARGGSAVAEALVEVPVPEPLRVEVQLSPGQPWLPADERVEVPVPKGGRSEVLVGLTRAATHASRIALRMEDVVEDVPLPLPSQRVVRSITVSDRALRLAVGEDAITLQPRTYDPAVLGAHVEVTDVRFPAGSDGEADPVRPPFRVTLPADGPETWLRSLGLGGRPSDPWAPWSQLAVELRNTSVLDADLVLSLKVRDVSGDADAFRPRHRSADGDTGTTAALLRVRAGAQATAVLPVHVDAASVQDGTYVLSVEVRPLGAGQPLHVLQRELHVTRGDPRIGVAFAASVLASLGSLAWSGRRIGGWLAGARTADLMTIALFGACLFVTGSAADVLALSFAALLGPFGSLLTGILADVARVTLLASLLVLLPRRGTLTLALLCGALLRGLVFGAFTPADLLYTGVSVAAAEACAALAGLTGPTPLPSGPPPRQGWLNIGIAFCGASVLTTLAGFCIHMVLYRLHYAGWYVALQVAVSGFLYPLLAARLAARVAPTLRSVAP
jgi:hypothetical protein